MHLHSSGLEGAWPLCGKRVGAFFGFSMCIVAFVKICYCKTHVNRIIMDSDFFFKSIKVYISNFLVLVLVLQWSWTAAGACRSWPCVWASCQRSAWLRPGAKCRGASKTCWYLSERRLRDTRRHFSQGRTGDDGRRPVTVRGCVFVF